MMKLRMMARLTLGLAITATTTTPALAEVQQGWYFGVSPGQSQYDISKSDLDDVVIFAFDSAGAPVVAGDSTLEDSDTTLAIFGGYRFSPFLAVEGGYVDLGTAEYRASGTVDPFGASGLLPATFNADFESKGFTAAAVGSLPLNDMFDVHARLGLLFADSEVSMSTTIDGERSGENLSGTSQDVFYGIGAALHFAANWSVSLDWQRYNDVGKDDETGETDVDSITLALSYRL